MMDGAGSAGEEAAVRAAASAYCVALHEADAATLDALCHPRFAMSAPTPAGTALHWDKATFLERVGGREAFGGDPAFGIEAVDVAGGEIAHVRLWVDVPPRRYSDYLGFVKLGGEWKLITKLYRTLSGPALEG
ncbi:nuclear transport factor 2 family protein [Histidinibacterium lentulum]|uniref:Nuclear transport factor 2 family protein n=1 Tax=Histidinibacterium lentulum TaxID=2480588 RepID=A0A3N2QTH8_9RHOB|nr:nuclear transport factor 2 family protein [Histidinibacterium lentulum]ROT98527.1 hypothetical protein EAT49_16435 [Histidinibacterium lentulum]